jgi:FAD/FMN-containing dehydrogenase
MSAFAPPTHPVGHPGCSLGGPVVFPSDGRFDGARRAGNPAIGQRPAAVVFPESAAEVASAVGYAAGRGPRIAAQGTGHKAGPLGSPAGQVPPPLVSPSPLTGT